jgi:hypothetical protein
MVLLQVPSARTKYVVVFDGVTEMLLPEATGVPAQLLLYHSQLAAAPSLPPDILNVEDLPAQIVAGLADAETAGCEVSRTVTV